MNKLNDTLLLIAGLALLPIVSENIGGTLSMYLAGLGIGIVGLKGLMNK